MTQKSDLMCCHVRGAWKVLKPGGMSVGEYKKEEEALKHIEAVELEMRNAEGIREDAGQVHQRGDVSGGSKEEGSADLQQQTPVYPPGDTQTQEVKRGRGRPRKVRHYPDSRGAV